MKIHLSDVEISTDVTYDCGGVVFSWICPDCGERLSWAPAMWWDLECCKGWNFNVIIESDEEINEMGTRKAW